MVPVGKMIKTIRTLLEEHAVDETARKEIAPMVAENSVKMNHLYEDMGFPDRKVMNAFMTKHFPTLAATRPEDVRWKKYLYDCVDLTAPACEGCFDKENCFGCELVFHPNPAA